MFHTGEAQIGLADPIAKRACQFNQFSTVAASLQTYAKALLMLSVSHQTLKFAPSHCSARYKFTDHVRWQP
jgi:hypothetical protein